MKKQKRELKFYIKEEEQELKRVIAENVNIKEYSINYASEYGRTPQQLYTKMMLLKNGKNKQEAFTSQQEIVLKHCLFRGDERKSVIERYSKEWNMPKKAIAVKLSWLSGAIQQTAKEEEGFLFEGTPKKVVLFSDHFKVYF